MTPDPAPTRGIVIPTFAGHFPAVLRFVDSYNRRATDPTPIPVHLVTSDEAETAALARRLPPGGRAAVSVVSVRDLLVRAGYPAPAAAEFSVRRLGDKYSYQSIKKIVGVLEFGYDQTLLLDSECIVYRPVSFHDVFAAYFAAPVVFHSAVRGPLLDGVNRASASVVGAGGPDVLGRWVFEYQGWFFEKAAVRAFRDHVERLHGRPLIDVLVATQGVFETVSYNWFLYTHRDRFPDYRFVPVEDVIREHLGPAADTFLAGFDGQDYGIIERMLGGLTPETFDGLRAVVNRYGLRFFRWERGTHRHYRLVREFLARTPLLAVIVCSESGGMLTSPWYWPLKGWHTARDGAKAVLKRSGLRGR